LFSEITYPQRRKHSSRLSKLLG